MTLTFLILTISYKFLWKLRDAIKDCFQIFDLNNEIESLDNRITDYESNDYGPFTVPSDSNYEEAPLINNMDRTGLISPIVSQDSESNLVCPFPFTPINQKIE